MKFGRKDYNGRIVDTQNKIPQDEPVFLLRGQDELAPRLLLMWAMEVRLRGGDPVMAAEAEAHAQEMIRWQKNNKVKTPDMYNESDQKKLMLSKISELISNIDSSKVKELITWVGKYKDDEGDKYVKILMRMDLKIESLNKPIHELEFNDFIISEESMLELYSAYIILYINNDGRIRVLKNRFHDKM